MKKLITLLTFLTGLPAFAQTASDPATEITALLQAQQLSGAVWATLENDSIKTYASGMANLKTLKPLKPTDKVHVGSITKTVLSMGILRLATEGKIDLDTPIKRILPGLPLNNPWEVGASVSIRHLLDHTSGLSDLRLWHFFSSSAGAQTPLSEFYQRNPEVLTIYAQPGTLFSYSNMGYTLLGMVIEKVTGQPYEDYLDRHLLKPIGMTHSTFHYTEQTHEKDLAMGHFDNGTLAPAYPIYVRPAGQLTTTAQDMGIFMRFMLNRGKIKGSVFIKEEYFDIMGKPAYTLATQGGLPNGYAFALQRRDRHGVTGLAHSGNIVGFRAMLYLFPDVNKGFFIAHNMDSETADYEVFNKTLIRQAGIPVVNPAQPATLSSAGLEKWNGYYVPYLTKVIPFHLGDLLGSFTQVQIKDDTTSLSAFQKEPIKLWHLGKGLFQQDGKTQASHLLYEKDGKLFLTTGFSTLVKINGYFLALLWASCLSGMLAIIFTFCSGVYYLIRRKGRYFHQPEAWPFASIVLLIIAFALIVSGGILHMGDKNAGTLLLCTASVALPLSALFALVAHYRRSGIRNLLFWSLLAIAQFSMVLIIYGIIPVITWK